MINNKITNFAVRVSDYESFENIYRLYPNCKWVWLEMFRDLKLKKKDIKFIKDNKIKICLVSPELHNKKNHIIKIKNFINQNNIKISAICTKFNFIKYWKKDL
mgnify:CR=1 FL=1